MPTCFQHVAVICAKLTACHNKQKKKTNSISVTYCDCIVIVLEKSVGHPGIFAKSVGTASVVGVLENSTCIRACIKTVDCIK